MDKQYTPVQVVTCCSTGDDQMVEMNVGRVPCHPGQSPLLKWCSNLEEQASTCGECVKPE